MRQLQPMGPSAETIFLLPGQGAGLNLLQGGEGYRHHNFIRKFLKVVAVLSLGLMNALMRLTTLFS
jgi:hypothetical protein